MMAGGGAGKQWNRSAAVFRVSWPARLAQPGGSGWSAGRLTKLAWSILKQNQKLSKRPEVNVSLGAVVFDSYNFRCWEQCMGPIGGHVSGHVYLFFFNFIGYNLVFPQ